MKIILTGCTGFVGTEVLHQCLKNPSITSIIVLSRKPLREPVNSNPKLTVKIIDDFLSYPETLLRDLRGAEACIWCLGIPYLSDMDMYRRVNVEFPMAAVKAWTQLSDGGKPFRFIYCSGAAAVRDQEKSLWVMQDMRRIRGQIENELIAYGEEHGEKVKAYILRPAMILSKSMTLYSLIGRVAPSIRVDTLAGVMLDVAIDGSQETILENGTMNRWARK